MINPIVLVFFFDEFYIIRRVEQQKKISLIQKKNMKKGNKCEIRVNVNNSSEIHNFSKISESKNNIRFNCKILFLFI